MFWTVVVGVLTAGAVAAGQASANVYWANYGKGNGTTIGRAKLDGSEVNDDFMTPDTPATAIAVNAQFIYWTVADVDDITTGIAADAEHIYWAEYASPSIDRPDQAQVAGAPSWSIGRANLDGSGRDDTFIPLGTQSLPTGMAVDPSHIYWGDRWADSSNPIYVANIDGATAPTQLLTGADDPEVVAVDVMVNSSHRRRRRRPRRRRPLPLRSCPRRSWIRARASSRRRRRSMGASDRTARPPVTTSSTGGRSPTASAALRPTPMPAPGPDSSACPRRCAACSRRRPATTGLSRRASQERRAAATGRSRGRRRAWTGWDRSRASTAGTPRSRTPVCACAGRPPTAAGARRTSWTPRDTGGVTRVLISVARQNRGLCRPLLASHRFGKPRDCRIWSFNFVARGTTRWAFNLRLSLKPGLYRVFAMGYDPRANREPYDPLRRNGLLIRVR